MIFGCKTKGYKDREDREKGGCGNSRGKLDIEI
jgi:hypothetical protein